MSVVVTLGNVSRDTGPGRVRHLGLSVLKVVALERSLTCAMKQTASALDL